MNTFGLPMTPDTAGVDTLNNMFEQGASCTVLILADEELVQALISAKNIIEASYEELRKRVEQEFAITMPTCEKCASVAAWLGQIIGAVFETVLDCLVAVAECVGKMAGAIVGGLFSGLGFGGSILVIGAIIVCLVLFL